MAPVSIVALATSLAALAAALGAVPVGSMGYVPARRLGWANAFAGGLMLGAAFVLAEEGLELRPWAGMGGVVTGILLVVATHALADAEGVDLDGGDADSPGYAGRIWAVQAVHGALEGIAIGVAAVLSLRLGVFLALAFAVHNVAEGTVLSAVLRRAGVGALRTAVLAVLSNAGQILLAVTAFALVAASPGLTSAALGMGTGALVYLVVVELLPEAYEEAGHVSIALVTTLLMGVILLLRGTLVR